ncbi:MAG: ABC-type dipeptide/oligopeptide/nickel transport system, permease component [uncultured Acidilobus sp. JCHS]|jgi:ABC-type dipeptide/oligopeptide/nickel transport systems, permease components|nr:MAG: ABC-type dipeptide/oligopeptide/nickel transport system, permease component [uncultured Acidilobus sp. JCHS]
MAKGGLTSRILTPERKLSLQVFFSNKLAVVGLVIVLAYVADALIVQFAPWLIGLKYPFKVIPDYSNPVPQPPSWKHPFGTTYPGIDLLRAVIKAIRFDLGLSVVIVVPGALLGIVIGIVATYFGGWVDDVLMRLTDIFFSVPYLVLAIAIGYALGRNITSMVIALIIVWWPLYARYTRSVTLQVKELTFIEAARAAGASNYKIMFRHILPNALPPVLVQMSMDLGTIMLVISGLAFIGFLPVANIPELGYLSTLGLNYINTAPWTVLVPGVFIVIFAVAVYLLGMGLMDVINPRRRSSL